MIIDRNYALRKPAIKTLERAAIQAGRIALRGSVIIVAAAAPGVRSHATSKHQRRRSESLKQIARNRADTPYIFHPIAPGPFQYGMSPRQ